MEQNAGKKKVFDFKVLGRVIRYASPYRSRLNASIVLALVLAVMGPVRPWLINTTVNDYIQHNMAEMVIRITLFQVALIVIETVLRFFFSYYTAWLGQTVVRDLRVNVLCFLVSIFLG